MMVPTTLEQSWSHGQSVPTAQPCSSLSTGPNNLCVFTCVPVELSGTLSNENGDGVMETALVLSEKETTDSVRVNCV